MKSKAKHIDAFISPSDFSARLHRQFGFDLPFSVIPNFVDDVEPGDCPAETTAEKPHVRPYFLFAGRLERMKGLQDVLPHFSATGPADLLVAGTGNDEAELRAASGKNPAIRFLGRLTAAELRPLYRHALSVVIPSLCYETFGMVMLEAFRERTPVIARAVGPLKDIVSKSGGGLLFSTSDQLAETLHRLANDSILRDQLAAAGYSSLRKRWTQRVVLERYLELVRNVACRKGLTGVCEILDAQHEAELTEPLSMPATRATDDRIPASGSFPSDHYLRAPVAPLKS
jgi:glycosyltransferase involved in cell wall biosynthesis